MTISRLRILLAFLFFFCITSTHFAYSQLSNESKTNPIKSENAAEKKSLDENISDKPVADTEPLDTSKKQSADAAIEQSGIVVDGADISDPKLASNTHNTPKELQGSSIAIKVIVTLLGVSLFIIGLGWLAKRMGVAGVASTQDMQILASLSLGQKEKAVLVDVLGKKIMLGVASGSVNTLHVFENAGDIAQYNSEFSGENAAQEKQQAQESLISGDSHVSASQSEEFSDLIKKSGKKDFSGFLKKILSSSVASR